MTLFQDFVVRWAEIMWPACWQGALAILVVWALVKGFGARMPAAWRPWPWRLAFLKLAIALVPLAGIALPVLQPAPAVEAVAQTSNFETHPDIFVPQESKAPAKSNGDTSFEASPFLKSIQPEQSDRTIEATGNGNFAYQPPNFRLLGLYLLFGLWSAGALREAFLLIKGAREAARIRREALPVEGETANDILRQLTSSLGLRREPQLLESAEVGPLLLGCWRPAIVLPSEMLASLEPEQLRLVLAHELAHLRRRDLHWALGTALVSLLFWFHPLVWLARRELRPATEEACDAMTLRATGAQPSVYGKLLLDVATGFGFKASPVLAVGVAEDAAALGTRLKALARAGLKPSRTKRIVLFIGAVVALVGIVPWRLTARAQSEDAQPSTKKSRLVEELTGNVLTADGQPAANVPLYFFRDYERPTTIAATATTDASGNYRLKIPASWSKTSQTFPPPRGNVVAIAGTQGFATQTWHAWRTKTPQTPQLRLPRLAKLVVNLRDEKGRPVVGQSIRLWKIGTGMLWRRDLPVELLNFYQGVSDERGQLVISYLPLGERIQLELGDVTLSAPDRWSVDVRGHRWAPLVKKGIVQLNEPVSRVTLRLQRTSQLTGRLRYKGNTKLAANSTVIADLINLQVDNKTESNRDSYGARATTGSDGRFLLKGLRPGTYKLWSEMLLSPKLGKGTTPIGTASVKAGGSTTVNLTLPITGPYRKVNYALVSGIVKSARTNKPVPRQSIGLKDSKGSYRYAYSDRQGQFRFQVPAGKQYVWVHSNSVSPPPGYGLPAKKDYHVSLENGEGHYIEVRLPDKGATKSLTGVVLDEDKKPVQGATVAVEAWGSQTGSGQQLTSIRTGANGRFSVAQKYVEQRVRLWANAGDLQSLKPAFGWKGDDVVLQVQRNVGCSIQGTVREKDNGPIPLEASIELVGFSPSGERLVAKTQIQADGTFRFNNQRAGREYMVRLVTPDYAQTTQFVPDVKPERVAQIELEVAQLKASLSGQVLTADGKPAPGVRVQCGVAGAVYANSQGYFKAPKVVSGTLSVMVSLREDHEKAWGPFLVKSGGPNVVIRLEDRMRWASPRAIQAVWPKLIGKTAPEIEISAWVNSRPIPLPFEKGKVKLLHFWNSSFPGAQPQPAVEELWQKYKDAGLQVIGIQNPGVAELPLTPLSTPRLEAQIRRKIEASGVTYPVALDDSETVSGQDGRAMGKTELKYQRAPIVIINRQGKIIFAGWNLKQVTEVLAKNLG